MNTTTCKKCGHTWIPRTSHRPKRCPQCKLWHPHQSALQASCECGSEWPARVEQPVRCIDCGRPDPKVTRI